LKLCTYGLIGLRVPRHIRYVGFLFPYLSSHWLWFVVASGIPVCELAQLRGIWHMISYGTLIFFGVFWDCAFWICSYRLVPYSASLGCATSRLSYRIQIMNYRFNFIVLFRIIPIPKICILNISIYYDLFLS
jgi:hypothetical protein